MMRCRLDPAKGYIPSKNFVLLFRNEEINMPNVMLGSNDTNTCALVTFVPDFTNLSIEDAYKA